MSEKLLRFFVCSYWRFLFSGGLNSFGEDFLFMLILISN